MHHRSKNPQNFRDLDSNWSSQGYKLIREDRQSLNEIDSLLGPWQRLLKILVELSTVNLLMLDLNF